jgi:hypothetical protein
METVHECYKIYTVLPEISPQREGRKGNGDQCFGGWIKMIPVAKWQNYEGFPKKRRIAQNAPIPTMANPSLGLRRN